MFLQTSFFVLSFLEEGNMLNNFFDQKFSFETSLKKKENFQKKKKTYF